MTSPGSVGNKDSLLKRLAGILDVGDDDNEYITDVLDQLIDIGEDADDVASYLTSFLGGDDAGDDVLQFADDVRRFKLGEEITLLETVDNPSTKQDAFVMAEKNPPSKQDNYTTHDRQLQQQRNEEKKPKKQQPIREALTAETPSRATSAQSSEIKQKLEKDEEVVQVQRNNGGPSKPKNNQTCSSTVQQNRSKRQGSKDKAVPMKEHQKPLPEIKKGKAKKVCGCFGTKHKPLTNCLHCGRISCEAEGYDFCPFCHILIEDFSTRIRIDNSSSSALLHKERLLEFDRTAEARTKVLDDQEEWYSSNSMWSTQEEQQIAREKEEERRKLLHERQKQTLEINF